MECVLCFRYKNLFSVTEILERLSRKSGMNVFPKIFSMTSNRSQTQRLDLVARFENLVMTWTCLSSKKVESDVVRNEERANMSEE